MIEVPLNQEIDRLFPPFLLSDGNSFAVGHEGYNISEGFSLNITLIFCLLVRNTKKLIGKIYMVDLHLILFVF